VYGAPMKLGPNVTVLEHGDQTIYLIGTAHISKRSVDEVRETIEAVQPDTVCIELCKTRYDSLMDENRWRKLNVFEVIKQGKVLFVLANLSLAAFQRRLGDKLGVKPGAEQLEAVHVAKEIGAELVLADRDIQATLKRTWRNLGFRNKLALLGQLQGGFFGKGEEEEITEETLEKLKESDAINEAMQAFAEELPQVQGPLIDERDQYLMSSVQEAPGKTIVAVVGAAHVPGMRRYLGKTIDRDALCVIPPGSRWAKGIKWIIPALILVAFYFGYQKNQGQSFEAMLWAWIIPNAVMAGLLTMPPIAKPLSTLTAIVASPITSLNPTIGAGMVVGLMEAWLRKPTVEDAERVRDIAGWRDAFHNPFTRVLIVAALATIGSALGAYIGAAFVVKLMVTG
jgi:pheromone shutdown-related protein TraB